MLAAGALAFAAPFLLRRRPAKNGPKAKGQIFSP
jgi:hypothetical protein